MRQPRINFWELYVVREWLERNPQAEQIEVRIDMDNSTAVRCLQHQGTPHSDKLLSLTQDIFSIVTSRQLHLSARFIPGLENDRADDLSRFWGISVEWHLRPQVFKSFTNRYGIPEVDRFVFETTAQLANYFTYTKRTDARGPNAFQED